MFALLAALAFLLACFNVTLGSVSMVELGLFLFALHFVVDVASPFRRG